MTRVTRPQRALGTSAHTVLIRNSTAAAEPADAPLAAFVRRWWLLLFLGSLLGLGAGYAYGKFGPASFQSTALLQARSDPSSTRPATDAQIAAIAYATEAIGPSILEHVSDALKQAGIDIGPAQLLAMSQTNKLTSQPVKGSSAITIQATHENPATAQAIADKVAQAAVDDAASLAQAEADARTKTIQAEISRTRTEMQGAQLYQHEQDLQQRLQTQQAELVQLQNGFTQTLQQQLQIELAIRQQNAPVVQPPVANTEQRRQLNNLSATASQALASQLATLKNQEVAAGQTLDGIDTQLASVRAQLSALPDPTSATAAADDPDVRPPLPSSDVTARVNNLQQQQGQLRDQMGQEQLLEKQEHDLQVQSNDLHNQLRTIEAQIQQANLTQQGQDQQRQQQQTSLQGQLQAEMNHQGLLKAQIDTIVPLKGQTDLNNNQQIQMQAALTALADSRAKVDSLNTALKQLAQTGTTAAATASASLQNLDAQRKSIQQASADMDAQLKDAQSRRASLQQALGPNPAGTIQSLGDQIQQLQQQQHDQDLADKQTQSRWVTLKQQETDLLHQRQDAQNQLLLAQREQQANIQRQTEVSQRDIENQIAQSGPQVVKPVNDLPLPASLIGAAADQREALLNQIGDQQQQLSASTATLNAQLDEVHKAQAALPVKLDPAQAAVLATVDAQKLGQLSQQYTKLLIDQATGVGPLQRFGPAAPAVPAGGQMRMLPLGAAGGLALAAALAGLLQVIIGRLRARPTQRPAIGSGESSNGRAAFGGQRPPLTSTGLVKTTRSYSRAEPSPGGEVSNG